MILALMEHQCEGESLTKESYNNTKNTTPISATKEVHRAPKV